MTFTDLGIEARFLLPLDKKGIAAASEIQCLVIPKLLAPGPDAPLFFSSPTGTGKTLAYALPLVQRLLSRTKLNPATQSRPNAKYPKLLVLAPTLELCAQIKKEFDLVAEGKSVLLSGSSALSRQIETIKKKKPLCIVGNPARILQLLALKKLNLAALEFIVLDEGDRLADRELFEDTAAILKTAFASAPPVIIACSATKPREGSRFFSLVKTADWEFARAGGTVPDTIEHWAFFTESRKKNAALRSFLAAAKPKKALVFVMSAGRCGTLVSILQHHHIAAAGLWSGMDKKARKAALDDFRAGRVAVLAASDLACRGLDIDGITHVIALETGESADSYLHRCGRTGRAGRRGIMATIGDEEDLRNLQKIEKKLGIAVYPKELRGGRVVSPESKYRR
ncbi:MAG: DEAD/DEAH box helicase [Treponema sp.]|jgi:superfamily II DNA/RNA helicase|nr:DEAD/DEAH box helicase [Treponema sp.]